MDARVDGWMVGIRGELPKKVWKNCVIEDMNKKR